MTSCMDLTGWSRKKTAAINIVLMIRQSLPCVARLQCLVRPSSRSAQARNVPLTSRTSSVSKHLAAARLAVFYLLFCTSQLRLGLEKNFKEEDQRMGGGYKVKDNIRFYVSYIPADYRAHHLCTRH